MSPPQRASVTNPRPRSAKGKPFIVDADARLFKGKVKLSRGAQSVYMLMRSLANGKTGELAIRGHALNWRYICDQGGFSRWTWLKYRQELMGAGLLWEQRDRLPRFDHKSGRTRIVLEETHYFIRRQGKVQKTVKKPMILLKSGSPTVEEPDPHNTQKHLKTYGAVPAFAVRPVLEPVVEPVLETHTQSSSSPPTATPKPDDDRASNPLQAKPDREIRGRDAAVSNWMKANELADPAWAEAAIAHINDPDRRKTWHPHDPFAFWTKCLATLTPEDNEKITQQANLIFDLRQNGVTSVQLGSLFIDQVFGIEQRGVCEHDAGKNDQQAQISAYAAKKGISFDEAVNYFRIPPPEVLEAYALGEIDYEQAGLHNWYSCEIDDCAQCEARLKACDAVMGECPDAPSEEEQVRR
jgi:hypothetical protein